MDKAQALQYVGGQYGGRISSLAQLRVRVLSGDYSVMTPERWCECWQQLRARMFPTESMVALDCYRCGGRGHYQGRGCEVCGMFGRTTARRVSRCPICDDRGVVRAAPGVDVDHPLYGMTAQCSCRGPAGGNPRLRAVLAQADVPEGYQSRTLDSFLAIPGLTESQHSVALMAGAWAGEAERWSQMNQGLRGFVFAGGVGVGKTSVSIGAVALAAEKRWQVTGMPRFASWLRWVDAQEHGWKKPGGLTRQEIADYARTPVLVLDDFGITGRRAPDHVVTLAESIWEARTTIGNPWTLVTTNLPDWAAMEREFESRVVSRMQGHLLWVSVDGPDMRPPE